MNSVTSEPNFFQAIAVLFFMISIVALVVIQIMFFIKVWNMTNHIKEIRDKFIGSSNTNVSFLEKLNPTTKIILIILSSILFTIGYTAII